MLNNWPGRDKNEIISLGWVTSFEQVAAVLRSTVPIYAKLEALTMAGIMEDINIIAALDSAEMVAALETSEVTAAIENESITAAIETDHINAKV